MTDPQTPRCTTCIHWSRPEKERYPLEVGRCKRVKQFWDSTEWRDVGDDYRRVFTPEAEGHLAFVQDASDYSAKLLTLADFGCVQYAERAP